MLTALLSPQGAPGTDVKVTWVVGLQDFLLEIVCEL